MTTIIKLAPGNIGWFDPLTSIHLTLAKTEAIINPGMNITNIKNALSEGKIIIKQGILETSKQINVEPIAIKTTEENIVTTTKKKPSKTKKQKEV